MPGIFCHCLGDLAMDHRFPDGPSLDRGFCFHEQAFIVIDRALRSAVGIRGGDLWFGCRSIGACVGVHGPYRPDGVSRNIGPHEGAFTRKIGLASRLIDHLCNAGRPRGLYVSPHFAFKRVRIPMAGFLKTNVNGILGPAKRE